MTMKLKHMMLAVGALVAANGVQAMDAAAAKASRHDAPECVVAAFIAVRTPSRPLGSLHAGPTGHDHKH